MPVSLKKNRTKSVQNNAIIEITPKHIMTEEQSLELLQKEDISNKTIAKKANTREYVPNTSLSIESRTNLTKYV